MPVTENRSNILCAIYSSNSYKKFERDVSFLGTPKKHEILMNLERYYRWHSGGVFPLCVLAMKSNPTINLSFEDFKISYTCKCKTSEEGRYVCDFQEDQQ